MKHTALQKWFSAWMAFVLVFCTFGTDALAAVLRLPADIEVIEEDAFYGATSLDEVVVPEGAKEIQSKAFADSSLTSIELPESVEYIAYDAFDGVEGLSVTAPEGSYAAEWWEGKQGADIETAPTSDFIYEIAEGECTITRYIGSDTKIAIPETIDGAPVVEIAYAAFKDCRSLTVIILPDCLSSIGREAFSGCQNLAHINIPNGILHLNYGTFFMNVEV